MIPSYSLLFLLSFTLVQATPYVTTPGELALLKRQAFSGPQTVQTTTTLVTSNGPVVEMCDVTLTPVTDSSGQAQVQQVQACSVMVSPTVSTAAASVAVTASSTLVVGASSTSAAVASTISSAPVAVVATGNPGVSVVGTTSVTLSAAASATPSANTSPAVTASSAADNTSVTSTGAVAISALGSDPSPTSSGSTPATAAAENAASSSAAPFVLPGKKLQVLPIGLGVFAGISVIALIVVGLVTYERTKYRKAFRQRKMAESGASMGYGGMAQRV